MKENAAAIPQLATQATADPALNRLTLAVCGGYATRTQMESFQKQIDKAKKAAEPLPHAPVDNQFPAMSVGDVQL